ncbi:MAG: hypothetical protein ABI234_10445 [Ktedonobacteraceae bacterium]
MVTFLLTVVVLSAFIIAGYCLSMYLYTRGVVGANMQSVKDEPLLMQSVSEMDQRERDYGLRYARAGILLIAGILVALVVSLIVALSPVLH